MIWSICTAQTNDALVLVQCKESVAVNPQKSKSAKEKEDDQEDEPKRNKRMNNRDSEREDGTKQGITLTNYN